MQNKIGAIIPIRLASERLPRKALKEICGRPCVYHLLDRVLDVPYLEKKNIVVCTTLDKSDDDLVEVVESYGASVFRGSTDDIIKRFYDAIAKYDFEYVIQVDGDDILCDSLYMKLSMDKLLEDKSLDIVTCEGLPLGIASKSFTRIAMEKVYAKYKTEKNDTGFGYFFTKTGICKVGEIAPVSHEHILNEARLTLDYEEDFEVFKKIIEALYVKGKVFGLSEVTSFLRENPEVMAINNKLDKEYWTRTKQKAKLEYQDSLGNMRGIEI
ncbi:acylneuraminate cytidylyltransferase [Candidatus Omnitrophus magneticus]|uniref:Acylneuraminate cytidylyltransferase n=1 Tax=Candidatus Omnitrophus magneticus TaxID=1609969 RepID=A0A0F0CU21_9BACT|nr:acylneuraminate cytidylyltransferase [Candidatus Omnitrophus magneticus]